MANRKFKARIEVNLNPSYAGGGAKPSALEGRGGGMPSEAEVRRRLARRGVTTEIVTEPLRQPPAEGLRLPWAVPRAFGDMEPFSFEFSNSLGTSPSTGTLSVLVRKGIDIRNWPELFEVTIHDIDAGAPLTFKKLHTTNIKKPYQANPLDEREVWTISFEDNRWRLAFPKVYGIFNLMRGVFGDKWIWDEESLEGEKPYSYGSLLKKHFKLGDFKLYWDPTVAATKEVAGYSLGGSIDFSKVKKATKQFPMNKKWDGKSLAEVTAELLREINCSLGVDFEGDFYITSLDARYQFSKTDFITAGATEGHKLPAKPDYVYIVGSRNLDQIKIEPDIEQLRGLAGNALDEKGIEKLIQKKGISGGGAPSEKELRKIENKFAELDESATGLEPVCPDISGKIWNLFELMDHWDVKVADASIIYQHKYDKASLWESFLSGGAINFSNFDPKKGMERLNETDKMRSNRLARERKKAEEIARAKLTPSEKEYLAHRGTEDIHVLASKVRIAMTYFFRLFRIPGVVKVKYVWSPEQKKIKERIEKAFKVKIPEGETEVPREYILPLIKYLNEPKFKKDTPYIIKMGDAAKESSEPGGEEDWGNGWGAPQDGATSQEENFIGTGGKAAAASQRLLEEGPHTELAEEEETFEGGKATEGKAEIPKKIEYPMRERVPFRAWYYGFRKVSLGSGTFNTFTLQRRIAEKGQIQVDAERGLFLFAKSPFLPSNLGPWSEYNPFFKRWCPVGVEFSYERKDPRLGVLNYFIYKIHEAEEKRRRGLQIHHYESIDDLVELLIYGATLNREQLEGLLDDLSPQYTLLEDEYSASVPFGVTVGEIPLGTCHSIAWSVSGSGVSTRLEINTGYEPGTKGSFKEKVKKELEARKLSVKHRTRFTQQSVEDATDLFMLDSYTMPEDSDERRVIYNRPHKGCVCLYDPKDEEDISFARATLIRPDIHLHDISWEGPILCRPWEAPHQTTIAGWIPLFGHLWWTYNVDHAPCDHAHAGAGGYYYPYVYMPPDGFREPIIVKNPVRGEEKLNPKEVYLETEGATDSLQKAQKWIETPENRRSKEDWRANPRTVPRNEAGKALNAGILIEYCIAAADAGAVTTYVAFDVDWQLVNRTESFATGVGADPRSGFGRYCLPIPAPRVAFEYQRQLLFTVGADVVQDFDSFAAIAERVVGDSTFHDPVYITAVKFVWDWRETSPIPVVMGEI